MTDANRPGEGEPNAPDATPAEPAAAADEPTPAEPAAAEPAAAEPAAAAAEPTPAEPAAAAAEPTPAEPAAAEPAAAAAEPTPAEPAASSVEPESPAAQPPSYPPPPSPTTTPPPPQAAPPAAVAPTPTPPPPSAPVRRRTWPRALSRIVAFLFGVLQALLILRIVLLLLIANPDNEIVSAILTVTDPFVEPFRGMFQLDEVTGQRGSVLDIAAVVAFFAWTLIETLILSLLRLFDRPSRS